MLLHVQRHDKSIRDSLTMATSSLSVVYERRAVTRKRGKSMSWNVSRVIFRLHVT